MDEFEDDENDLDDSFNFTMEDVHKYALIAIGVGVSYFFFLKILLF